MRAQKSQQDRAGKKKREASAPPNPERGDFTISKGEARFLTKNGRKTKCQKGAKKGGTRKEEGGSWEVNSDRGRFQKEFVRGTNSFEPSKRGWEQAMNWNSFGLLMMCKVQLEVNSCRLGEGVRTKKKIKRKREMRRATSSTAMEIEHSRKKGGAK